MKIWIGTKVSISFEEMEGHIAAYYVGEKKGAHIVLTFTENRHANIEKLKAQSLIQVQYFENNFRYEFKSRVIEVLDEPVDLIVLEYPSEIYSIDKRVMDRINCLISAKLKNRFNNDTTPVVGVIANINKSGCLCRLTKTEQEKTSFHMDEQVELRCQFPGLIGEQSAEGKIVRIHEEAIEIVIGIQFSKEILWVPPYTRK